MKVFLFHPFSGVNMLVSGRLEFFLGWEKSGSGVFLFLYPIFLSCGANGTWTQNVRTVN